MVEEIPGEQEQTSPKEQLGVEDVVAYVEEKIAHQRELIQRREKGHAVRLDISPGKAQTETERLEKMKDAVIRGEYRGVIVELQKDAASEEQTLEGWKKELNRELKDDNIYFELKDEIMGGQEVLGKMSDESSKTWVTKRINDLKEKQEKTERASVLRNIEQTQERIDHLQALQKVASAPPVSPSPK